MSIKWESDLFFKSKKANWEQADSGITRQIVAHNQDLMVVSVKFKPGAIGRIHDHLHTQGSYVASGKFKITINGNSEILEAGDGFYVPPHAPHGAECLEEGILIDAFNPAREDFL
ncbi:cupin domain-containing protein [Leeuwenhoekiella sp. MAR_2009_132]|uniref:cupin domain-containing protein n=1 Tax=Leeuwenhoekiella sp. MAR_2009_132 TaxID=1392489 RepID=UPI00068FA8DA|nr:cupin domain-containing protein [Leeuwenhoekiella sp. MAR_2009_132]